MFMYGKNITLAGDYLEKININQLIKMINGNNIAIKAQIENLRHVKLIDRNAYKKLKLSLPYITVAIFSPPHRKTENVAYAEYIIIDLDGFNSEGELLSVKKKIIALPSVLLCFISPGGSGLKIIYKLNKKISDGAYYKLFYKYFSIKICQQLSILHNVDLRACDITRCTFISYDSNIYYNENPIPVNPSEYLNEDNTFSVTQITEEIEKTEKEIKQEYEDENNSTLPDDVLIKIKKILNPDYKPPQKNIYVPEELEKIIPLIEEKCKSCNLVLESVINIQYGKKLKITSNKIWAEVNIFYGKKGFSVVKTPKNGSNLELADLVCSLIKQTLNI